jgi:sterol desaturase/sphingolipid hydroxylase (fatty acid hydroxylase superfamily)
MTIWSGLALMLGMEFSYYWFHRVSHRVRWFWCAHVVHHSGEHMNMTTAMRQSLTYSLNFSTVIFWVPLMLIGFPPSAVMFALALNLAYQFFIHTESMDKWPAWAEFLLNTPSHHRAHHGRNDQYIDKNYGGILIIWDRLFGTFEPEVEKVEYGVVRPIDSHNLITLNFHEWKEMFKDVLQPGPLSLRLKHLWKGPEWQRPAPAATTDDTGILRTPA